MTTIRKVRGKNFFSIGNAFLEIELDASRRTIFMGKNGVGKSTLLNMISFALFGKTIKPVTKPRVVNSINGKNCVVEIELEDSGASYLIRRGVKPNVFEIFKDGVLLDQTLVGEYQDHLEQKIIKCSHRTFMQTSIISIENYRPFMSLSASDRREFVEDILDIKVFTIMNTLNKQSISKNKEAIKLAEVELESIMHSARTEKAAIDRVEAISASSTKAYDDTISENRVKMELAEIGMEAQKEATKKYDQIIAELKEKLSPQSSLRNSIAQTRANLETIKNRRSKYKNLSGTTCPQCDQDVPHEHVQKIIDSDAAEIEAGIATYKDLKAEYDALEVIQTELDSMLTERNAIDREYDKHAVMYNQAASAVRTAEAEKRKLEVTHDLEELRTNLKLTAKKVLDQKSKLSELKTEKDYLATMAELLKDSGIKSKIVDQYVPVINTLVNTYLEKLDFFVSFHLDSEFNETIKSRHRDEFTYSSFSAGERQRIDLALLFTFRQIAKMKNSFSCNLLLLDEVLDASLDSNGIDNLLSVFEMDEFKSSNLFVISHRNGEMLSDVFDRTFSITKEQGFTHLQLCVE